MTGSPRSQFRRYPREERKEDQPPECDHHGSRQGRRDRSRSPPGAKIDRLRYDDDLMSEGETLDEYDGRSDRRYRERDHLHDHRRRGSIDRRSYSPRRGSDLHPHDTRPRRDRRSRSRDLDRDPEQYHRGADDYSRDEKAYKGLRRYSRSPSPSRGRYRSRSRSRSVGRGPGMPSDTIILEGLPPSSMTTGELGSALHALEGLSKIHVVDIRIPSRAGRRAFVQFKRVNDAIDFMRNNFPKLAVSVPVVSAPGATESISLYIHYARSRDAFIANSGTAWLCSKCDLINAPARNKCKVCGTPQMAGQVVQSVLTGETDMGTDPSQILVVFPLDDAGTEEGFASEMRRLEDDASPLAGDSQAEPLRLKSTAPVGSQGPRAGSLHRVFIMRDRSSHQSLKFGFAEFWTQEDSVAALTKFQLLSSFSIFSNPVTISTIHLGVFVPDLTAVAPESDKYGFRPVFNPALRVKYWHPDVYASAYVASLEPPSPGPALNSTANPTGTKKTKKRKVDGGQSAVAASKAAPAMAGQLAMWHRKHAELVGVTNTSAAQGDGRKGINMPNSAKSSNDGASSTDLAGLEFSALSERTSIRMVMGAAATPVKPATNCLPVETPLVKITSQPSQGQPTHETQLSQVTRKDIFIDHEKICCWLCRMKYKSADDLATHQRSRNHKGVLADEAKVKAAQARLTARDENADAESSTPQYRDRAKERREVFNQPDRPAPATASTDSKIKGGKPKVMGSNAGMNPTPVLEQLPVESKGSAMLAKMGWTKGQGLGANGEGRVDAIEATAYLSGVGLGAEGGNLGDATLLAEKMSKNDRADYLNVAQEKARERYKRLG